MVLGSGGAQWYRLRNPRADPLICAFGILISVPFAFFGIVIAHKSATLSWITIFIAITFLCVNWTLVADILLYVIPPNRRSFAQAIQILVAHLLGDAFSPYLVGSVSFIIAYEGNIISINHFSSCPMVLGLAIQQLQSIVVFSTHCTRLLSCWLAEGCHFYTTHTTLLPTKIDVKSKLKVRLKTANVLSSN